MILHFVMGLIGDASVFVAAAALIYGFIWLLRGRAKPEPVLLKVTTPAPTRTAGSIYREDRRKYR